MWPLFLHDPRLMHLNSSVCPVFSLEAMAESAGERAVQRALASHSFHTTQSENPKTVNMPGICQEHSGHALSLENGLVW